MSLYRQPGQARRRRRIAAAATSAAVLLLVALVVVVTRDSGPPTQAERASAAASAASLARNGLEVLRIEYGQAVRDGRVVAPTEYRGARADVQRVGEALTSHEADLRAVDASALAEARAALRRVAVAVDRRAPSRDVDAAVAKVQRPLTLFRTG
jgi:hypothetical protein